MKNNKSRERMAVTSSLNAIQISPRTPKTPHPDMGGDEDDVELSLLNEAERLQSARAFPDEAHSLSDTEPDTKRHISAKDKRGMVLLCVLCEYIDLSCVIVFEHLIRSSPRNSGILFVFVFETLTKRTVQLGLALGN
jgi:hypothetical protein